MARKQAFLRPTGGDRNPGTCRSCGGTRVMLQPIPGSKLVEPVRCPACGGTGVGR